MSAVTYLEAIGQAMREEMQRDEAVFLLGEDVGNHRLCCRSSVNGHAPNCRNPIHRLHHLWL